MSFTIDIGIDSFKIISIHAPAKGATGVCRSCGYGRCISIHAPAKGATSSYPSCFHRRNFNPRSREGSDHRQGREGSEEGQFQSTLPRRERQIGPSRKIFAIAISIHAPAKGATLSLNRTCVFNQFQSTLPRRERQLTTCIVVSQLIFQSTLPRRERPQKVASSSDSTYFNPRSREGSDKQAFNFLKVTHNFNPRSREGSDVPL